VFVRRSLSPSSRRLARGSASIAQLLLSARGLAAGAEAYAGSMPSGPGSASYLSLPCPSLCSSIVAGRGRDDGDIGSIPSRAPAPLRPAAASRCRSLQRPSSLSPPFDFVPGLRHVWAPRRRSLVWHEPVDATAVQYPGILSIEPRRLRRCARRGESNGPLASSYDLADLKGHGLYKYHMRDIPGLSAPPPLLAPHHAGQGKSMSSSPLTRGWPLSYAACADGSLLEVSDG